MNVAVLVIAILAIAGVLCYALRCGHDGILLSSGVAIIAGLAGYQANKVQKLVRSENSKQSDQKFDQENDQ